MGVSLRVDRLDDTGCLASVLNLAIFAHFLQQCHRVNVGVPREYVGEFTGDSTSVDRQDLDTRGHIVACLELFHQRVDSETVPLHLTRLKVKGADVDDDR